jgi:hypothetical protein
MLGLLWILPLFPAQPKLGPVFHEVHQFIPNGFPLLLIVPALVLDLLWTRLSGLKSWQHALVGGVVFLAVFWAVEWPFADFLQSPLARNPIFGSEYAPYFQNPKGYLLSYRFIPPVPTAAFASGMGIAFICSVLSMWIGLATGDWLKRVRR